MSSWFKASLPAQVVLISTQHVIRSRPNKSLTDKIKGFFSIKSNAKIEFFQNKERLKDGYSSATPHGDLMLFFFLFNFLKLSSIRLFAFRLFYKSKLTQKHPFFNLFFCMLSSLTLICNYSLVYLLRTPKSGHESYEKDPKCAFIAQSKQKQAVAMWNKLQNNKSGNAIKPKGMHKEKWSVPFFRKFMTYSKKYYTMNCVTSKAHKNGIMLHGGAG